MFERIATLYEYDFLTGMPLEIVRAHLKDWNPTGNLDLLRFRALRFTLQQEWVKRNGRFKREYWRRLPFIEQLIAEAESEWLVDAVNWCVANEQAILERLLNAADEGYRKLVDDPISMKKFAEQIARASRGAAEVKRITKLQFASPERIFTTADQNRRRLEMGAAEQLFPFDHPVLQDERQRLTSPISEGLDEQLLLKVPGHRESVDLRDYRVTTYGVQSHLRHSYDCLLWDLDSARQTHNELTGAAAKQNTLLVNEGIPIPSHATIAGWHQYCNIATRRLVGDEAWNLKGIVPFRPAFISTFVPPLMPMSKEHLTQSLVSTDDSQAAWSLAFKSRGHDRDPDTNRIRYGHWDAITVILGEQMGQMALVVQEPLGSMEESSLAIHERHLDLLPSMESTIHLQMVGKYRMHWMMDNVPAYHAARLKRFVADANMANVEWMPLLPNRKWDSLIMPWAAMSKTMGMHFRFDDGHSFFMKWCGIYVEALHWHLLAPMIERQRVIFETEVGITNALMHPDASIATKKGGLNTRFDFTEE